MPLLSLGLSPCPNDTFIFDALLNQRLDVGDLQFSTILTDVEELNQLAFRNELDITKVSYHAFLHLTDTYQLLSSGSAIGFECGPLLVAKKDYTAEEIKSLRVAIPGKNTTANLLLDYAFPGIHNKIEMQFSSIEQAVLEGSADVGLIIHESRFTYHEKGLIKIEDLGEFWQNRTGCPIPLGGIIIKKNLPSEIKIKFSEALKKSVSFAFENPDISADFVKKHAQEMDDEVIKKHIALYVNEFSLDLGIIGRKAINMLFEYAKNAGKIENIPKSIIFE